MSDCLFAGDIGPWLMDLMLSMEMSVDNGPRKGLDKFLKAASDDPDTVLHYEFMQDYKVPFLTSAAFGVLSRASSQIQGMLSASFVYVYTRLDLSESVLSVLMVVRKIVQVYCTSTEN